MFNKVITQTIETTEKSLWATALELGDRQNHARSPLEIQAYTSSITKIREQMGEAARTSTAPTTVEFGTSGWRGRIGEDFTIRNVQKVTRAIIDTMRSETFLEVNGYKSFDEVKEHGVVVFRDNRYMGDEFIAAALNELHAAGIKTYHAGECPTGVGSAVVTELRAAASINFTPSHNPMDYAGLKFNPADGGSADKNITDIIQARANEYMQDVSFAPYGLDEINNMVLNTRIDPVNIYLDFLGKSKVIDLQKIKEGLLANQDRITIIVDNMHGASRGVIEKILGPEVIEKIDIRFKNTETDYSFHGVKPEPSDVNQKPLITELNDSDRPLTLAVALDPDADRIRFADRNLDIEMNRFSAIALDYAIKRGLTQGLVTSVASSGFAASIAKQNNLTAASTAVGFKNFRTALTQGTADVAFEESDGISFTGHTLEKDGIIGFLVALAAMLENNANLSQIFFDLQKKYGCYFPGKDGQTITGVTIEEWQKLRKQVLDNIHNSYSQGDTVFINETNKRRISEIQTVDGIKFIFEDDSWILLRSSGTETKFRFYYETTGKENERLSGDYRKAADNILQKALEAARK